MSSYTGGKGKEWEEGRRAYEMLALSFSLFLNVPLGHICHRKYVGANKRLRQRTGGQAKDLGNELAGAHTARTAKQNLNLTPHFVCGNFSIKNVE